MKSLQDKLKLSGQQGLVSNEEMQALAGKAGRSVPITPLEGSVIGGNQDQTKMLGSKANKAAVLNPADTLQKRVRLEQKRGEQTEEEQQKAQGAESLNKLSSLEDRVQNITTNMLNQQQTGTVNLSLAESTLAEDPDVQSLLTDLSSAVPGSPEALELTKQLNIKMGRDQSNILSGEEILSKFKPVVDSLGAGLAEGVQNQILVSDLDLPSLGFQDNTELASLLGLAPEELDGLKLEDLQQKINAKIQEEYTSIDNLNQVANDPARSAAERAKARKELRDLGAVGIRSIESDIDSLADQIENANTVDYLGEEYAVSELLDDEVVSGLAAKYLETDGLTTDEWKKQFKEQSPELAKWLDENKAALEGSLSQIDDTVKEFADIQNSNKALKVDSNGQELSEDIAEKIIPGYNQLSTERIDVDSNPILKILKGTNLTEAGNLHSALTTLNDMDPNLVSELTSLTPEQLMDFGIAQNNSKFNKFLAAREEYQKVKDIPNEDYPSFFKEMFGKEMEDSDIIGNLQEMIQRDRSGLFGGNPLEGIAKEIVGKDGKLLPIDQVATILKNKLTPIQVKQFLQNPNRAKTLTDKFSKISNYNKALDTTDLYSKVKDAFGNDNKIDRQEAKNLNLSKEDYSKLLEDNLVNLDGDAANFLENRYTTKIIVPEVDTYISDNKLLEREDIFNSINNLPTDFSGRKNIESSLSSIKRDTDHAVSQLKQLLSTKEKGTLEYRKLELVIGNKIDRLRKAFDDKLLDYATKMQKYYNFTITPNGVTVIPAYTVKDGKAIPRSSKGTLSYKEKDANGNYSIIRRL